MRVLFAAVHICSNGVFINLISRAHNSTLLWHVDIDVKIDVDVHVGDEYVTSTTYRLGIDLLCTTWPSLDRHRVVRLALDA